MYIYIYIERERGGGMRETERQDRWKIERKIEWKRKKRGR